MTVLSFSSSALLNLYTLKKYDEISEKLLEVLSHFEATNYVQMSPDLEDMLEEFVSTFLLLFTQPDYVLSDKFVQQFLRKGFLISNLVKASSVGSTDRALRKLLTQTANCGKVLTLLSARNKMVVDRKMLFDSNAPAANIWYVTYAHAVYGAMLTEQVQDNLVEHFRFQHPDLKPTFNLPELYFSPTYTGPEEDRIIKGLVNRISRTDTKIKNTPNPNKIAVLSGFWFEPHSVWRNYFAYVRELKKKYHLTFFNLLPSQKQDTSLFDEAFDFTSIEQLANNDFGMIYYPDIGMSPASITLANHRLAPIQFCSPGHSVSTHGADIDYFISGQDVEEKINPQQHYSERLVLLPGMGVIHEIPQYVLRGANKGPDVLYINCPWLCQKINTTALSVLKQIIQGTKKRLKFRLFVGSSSLRHGGHTAFHADLKTMFGDTVEAVVGLGYGDYMEQMELGDITIDSFHFGGCNTISDSLFLGIPTITWEGTKWYNRIGSEMLRLVGVEDCIAHNEKEYVSLVLKMIEDNAYRATVRKRISKASLNDTIYSVKDAPSFLAAVDAIAEHHEEWKTSKGEIIINRDGTWEAL